MICHLSLGINVSILLILLIFGVLFSLPLKLLLNTNYGTRMMNDSGEKIAGFINRENEVPKDLRSLKLCENFQYELTVKSVFFSSYDRNCTIVKEPHEKLADRIQRRKSKLRLMAENAGIIASEFADENNGDHVKNDRKKSIIAGHILAVMLIGSAVAALVEVLRARFCPVKAPRSDGNSATGRRRSSLVDNHAQRRHVRKDTIQAQKSFEIQGMMHRSPLRLLAARPPPLLRRSSFPAQCLIKKDISVSTTGPSRLSRRPSFIIDSEEDLNGLTDMRRHSRLIRRH